MRYHVQILSNLIIFQSRKDLTKVSIFIYNVDEDLLSLDIPSDNNDSLPLLYFISVVVKNISVPCYVVELTGLVRIVFLQSDKHKLIADINKTKINFSMNKFSKGKYDHIEIPSIRTLDIQTIEIDDILFIDGEYEDIRIKIRDNCASINLRKIGYILYRSYMYWVFYCFSKFNNCYFDFESVFKGKLILMFDTPEMRDNFIRMVNEYRFVVHSYRSLPRCYPVLDMVEHNF